METFFNVDMTMFHRSGSTKICFIATGETSQKLIICKNILPASCQAQKTEASCQRIWSYPLVNLLLGNFGQVN